MLAILPMGVKGINNGPLLLLNISAVKVSGHCYKGQKH